MWVGFMTLEYVNYVLWAPQTKQVYLFTIHTFRLTLEYLGGVILPPLFTIIIIHPGTIHMRNYSFRYYSLNVLFIATLSLKMPI